MHNMVTAEARESAVRLSNNAESDYAFHHLSFTEYNRVVSSLILLFAWLRTVEVGAHS